MALSQITSNCSANIIKLSFQDPAESVVGILSKYSTNYGSITDVETSDERSSSIVNTKHVVDEYNTIFEYICLLTINICQERVGQHKFGAAGICRLIPTFLSKYEKSPSTCSLICMVISTLCHKFPENQSRLGASGTVKAIVCCFEFYVRTTGMSIDSLFFSRNNSMQSNNQNMKYILSHESIDAEFIATLNHYRPSLLIDGFLAIENMATGNQSNRGKFQASSVLDILSSIISLPENKSYENNYWDMILKSFARQALDSII